VKRFLPVAVGWLLAAGLASYLGPMHQKLAPQRPQFRIQDLLVELLGEGSTMLARLLWFKMDLMHEQQDDLNVETFKQKEVVPLLRMINYLDPQLTDAYDTLAYELYLGYQQTEKAVELVEEGLLYSPESYELHFRRAFLAERTKDYLVAFEHAQAAYNFAQEDIQRVAALRTLYRCAGVLDQPEIGVTVIDRLTELLGTRPYPEQYSRWKARLKP